MRRQGVDGLNRDQQAAGRGVRRPRLVAEAVRLAHPVVVRVAPLGVSNGRAIRN